MPIGYSHYHATASKICVEGRNALWSGARANASGSWALVTRIFVFARTFLPIFSLSTVFVAQLALAFALIAGFGLPRVILIAEVCSAPKASIHFHLLSIAPNRAGVH